MKIAIVTPEYPTTLASEGGLAIFSKRLAISLSSLGHDVHVVVPTSKPAWVVRSDGVNVHHVDVSASVPRRLAMKSISLASVFLRRKIEMYLVSRRLMATVLKLDREGTFDFIHLADHLALGCAIPTGLQKRAILRCSSAAEVYARLDGTLDNPAVKAQIEMEEISIRKAAAVFAPSRTVADFYRMKTGVNVEVLRPAAFLEEYPGAWQGPDLPKRFFLHFAGTLCRRKGSLFLIETLSTLKEMPDDFCIVLAGKLDRETSAALETLPAGKLRMIFLGPLPRNALYEVIRRAEASLLLSKVDNIPNTALESLLLGTPVVATFESSLDEVLADGVSGRLISFGDRDALAAVLRDIWDRGWPSRASVSASLPLEFHPEAATRNYLEFAGRLLRSRPVA